MLVLPTYREGFPNVALEAAACGIPIITTTATGARDAVLPNATGIQVEPGDSRGLCDAICELAENPERARSMGLAARAWSEKNFVDRHVQALGVSFYRDLLADARRVPTMIPATDAAASAD